jgi:pimeloyl-ACP methyl ester carboxylesterase
MSQPESKAHAAADFLDLTPPRMLEELSGRIDKLAPPPRMIDELSGQVGKLAPAAVNEYVRDLWQRSVLFLDILRQRGNQHDEMATHGVTSVLMYESELVMRGDELPHPVNYSLLRVIPPEGAEIDDRNRPVVVIDPRAGQGPGIGGFKQMSEIGEAFRAGHPVYFAGFTASPVDGQRIEDVARAYTIFLEKVAELHPEALGKPFVFGNCQAGWHAMMAACMRPDVVGPMVIAGAPLSYWGGVRGKNAMRYLGGWFGGSWLDRMMSDVGGGTFDAAWLVANFDNLNPANTLWTSNTTFGPTRAGGGPLPAVREVVGRFRRAARRRDAVDGRQSREAAPGRTQKDHGFYGPTTDPFDASAKRQKWPRAARAASEALFAVRGSLCRADLRQNAIVRIPYRLCRGSRSTQRS